MLGKAEKAVMLPVEDGYDAAANVLMNEIFKRQPALEADLMRFASGQ